MGNVTRAAAVVDTKFPLACGLSSEGRGVGRCNGIGRLGVALVAAAIVGSLGACGSSDRRGNGPTPSSSAVAPATTTTLPPATTEVTAAWRRFWDVYVAASNPMNPADPRLKDVATGEELRTLTSAFLASKTAGEVYKGDIELTPSDVNVTGDTATLRDCYLSRILAYDATTGALRDQASNVRRLVRVSLQREGGTWRVARISHEGDGCIPGA